MHNTRSDQRAVGAGQRELAWVTVQPKSGPGLAQCDTGLKAITEVYFRNTKTANPCHYGYATEVTAREDGSYGVTKHYERLSVVPGSESCPAAID